MEREIVGAKASRVSFNRKWSRGYMQKEYQVVMVGSGPSAIFAALTLSGAGVREIAIFEKGKDIDERKRGRGMELLCGWGGAGAFSDGRSEERRVGKEWR